MSTRLQLLQVLSNGKFHSGQDLGAELGISRAAVWKSLKGLAALGVDIQAVSGKGYRLHRPIELLDQERILTGLDDESRRCLSQLDVQVEIDSTNRYLKDKAKENAGAGYACFAEYQHAGRGRRGRHWCAPFGANILFSVLWRFWDGPARLSGLSLAVGVAVANALRSLGVEHFGLKWPNDLVATEGKLAGILLEVAGETNGPCHAVVGIGLNLSMPQSPARNIEQPWIDLDTLRPGLGRNQVAGTVLHHVLLALKAYESKGLSPFLAAWAELDVLTGQPVVVKTPAGEECGTAMGVDERGLLIVDFAAGKRCLSYGDVTIRRTE